MFIIEDVYQEWRVVGVSQYAKVARNIALINPRRYVICVQPALKEKELIGLKNCEEKIEWLERRLSQEEVFDMSILGDNKNFIEKYY